MKEKFSRLRRLASGNASIRRLARAIFVGLIGLTVVGPSLPAADVPRAPAAATAGANPSASLPDPIPVGELRRVPHRRSLPILVLVALAPAALAWVAFAAHRAGRDDPWRERRRAHRALLRLFANSRGRSPTRAELETWRALCVRLWAIPESVPTLDELTRRLPEAAAPPSWLALWSEAEESLYSARFTLPADWPIRAADVVHRIPRFPGAPWLPRQRTNWFPALLVTGGALSVAIALHPLQAADAVAAYQGGHFSDARKMWLQVIAQHPEDWAAHHDLALAFAQEDQWGQAAGHWTAAFLLNPTPIAVTTGLRQSLNQVEGVDAALKQILSGSRYGRVARLASVARWQELSGGAAATLSLGLVGLVASAYVRRSQPWRGIAIVIAGLGGSALVAALFAVREYGPLGDPQAAFIVRPAELRSIPSDLVTKQQTSTLFAGTIVKVNRSFLGWDQISLGPEVAGWVRTDSLVWLYRHRDDSMPATIQRP